MSNPKSRLKRRLVARDGTDCSLCHEFMPVSDRTIDHVYPRSKGGTDDMSNLKLAHNLCNSRKGNVT